MDVASYPCMIVAHYHGSVRKINACQRDALPVMEALHELNGDFSIFQVGLPEAKSENVS